MKSRGLFWLWSGLVTVSAGTCGPAAAVTQEERPSAHSGSSALAEPSRTSLQESQHVEVVKLGLLIPGGDEALAAKHGAEMAVAEANKAGGLGGLPFELIARSIEGAWGSGTKEIVRLVFEDGVWAVLGALDGRGTHLAEQIVTKALVALVSPWSTDPTLTQINIPWFFRCVPDDRQQARVLVNEIFRMRRLRRVATVAADTYDAGMAAATFGRIAAAAGHPVSIHLPYGDIGQHLQVILSRIEDAKIEGVVLFGPPSPTARLIRQMRAQGMKQALFGPLSIADDEFFLAAESALEGAVFVAPGHWATSRGKAFQREYQGLYGHPPSALAAYAYDGMRLIIEAIEEAGLDRERIRDALAATEFLHGVSGAIRFDAKGNRLGPVDLIEIINGRPSFLQTRPLP